MNTYFKNLKSYILIICFLSFCEIQGNTQSQTPDPLEKKLLDIGYHKLFIREKGPQNAKFTVVFESGAGGGSQDWEKVIAMLPSEIRIVAYDRAGAGKSEQGPLPRTMAQEVYELHKLLNAAKVKGSIILVGQSMGGLLVRLYTERYGNKVAGLVLVDPAHENGFYGSIKYGGWVRLREKAEGKHIPKPQLIKRISTGYDSTADYMAEEFQKIFISGLKTPQKLKSRPLIIIGAGIRNPPPGTPDAQWKKLRSERDQQVQDLTVLSSNSRFILDHKSSHQIQNDNPEIVKESIRMVLNSITSKTKL